MNLNIPSLSEEDRTLRAHIAKYAYMNMPSCDTKTREFVANVVFDFVTSAIHKFNKGQEEHGGDFLTTCDHTENLKEEVIDAFFYNAAQRHKAAIAKEQARCTELLRSQLELKQLKNLGTK